MKSALLLRDFVCSCIVVALVGCGGAGGANLASGALVPSSGQAQPSTSPASITFGRVIPSNIESGTNPDYDAPDLFTTPSGSAKNELFVFLPGTGGIPSMAQDIMREAASRGYHVIGLTYVNGTEVNDYCSRATDPSCWGNVRDEVVYGNGTSTFVSVTPADSIVGRLTALLKYLNSTYPTEGWGQYLRLGNPVWSRIVVGGHSQGAGDSTYLAKGQSLAGACAFDSPDDGNVFVGRAAWLSEPNATATGAIYGFTNQDDDVAAFSGVTKSWSLIGMPGAPYDVDGHRAPYGSSHQLYTVASSSVTSDTHGYTVVDSATPVVNGVPVYAPVWDTVCFSN